MNKKILFTTAILLSISMMGCQKKKVDKHGFKDNYEFGELIESAERDEILAKVFDNLKNVVSTTNTFKYDYQQTLSRNVSSGKTTNTYYDNYYYVIKDETNNVSEESGIKFTSKDIIETHVFISSDGKFQTRYTLRNLNGEESISTSNIKYPDEAATAKAKREFSYPERYQNMFEDYSLYKKGKSYVAIESQKSELHTPKEYGNDTRELIQIEELQCVYEINAKYQLTKFSSIGNSYSNLDGSTKEYTQDVKLLVHEEDVTTYKYGTRASGDFSKYEEQFNKPMQNSYTNYRENGKYADGAWTKNGEANIGSGAQYYTTDLQTRLFSTTFSFKPDSTNNAFTLYHSTDILDKYVTDAEMKHVRASFPSLADQVEKIEGLSIVGKTEAGDEIILAEEGKTYKLRLEFVATVTGVDAIQFSDVKLINYYAD
jgi:hypothetical protein